MTHGHGLVYLRAFPLDDLQYTPSPKVIRVVVDDAHTKLLMLALVMLDKSYAQILTVNNRFFWPKSAARPELVDNNSSCKQKTSTHNPISPAIIRGALQESLI